MKSDKKELAEENLQQAISLGHPDAANKLKELGK